MRDETIRAGDLVMIVRAMPCCGALTGVEGAPFVVTRVIRIYFNTRCVSCRHLFLGDGLAAMGSAINRPIRLERLQKINPPAIKQSTERETELTA